VLYRSLRVEVDEVVDELVDEVVVGVLLVGKIVGESEYILRGRRTKGGTVETTSHSWLVRR
jgi:hypothetical protein